MTVRRNRLAWLGAGVELRSSRAELPSYVWLQNFGGGAAPPEPAYLTGGDDLRVLGSFLAGRTSYTAADVIQYLLPENESAV